MELYNTFQTLKTLSNSNFGGVNNSPNYGNLEANPQIKKELTATVTPNPPRGNLILNNV